MSDRYTIVTMAFVAGLMLGAFTVQLKDQISLQLGTLGFSAIMQCAATGPCKYLVTCRRTPPLSSPWSAARLKWVPGRCRRKFKIADVVPKS
jgi:hypothetical protein